MTRRANWPSQGVSPFESTVTQRGEGADSASAPLRNRLYRNLFIAQFVSNVGTWMQSVAAQSFLDVDHDAYAKAVSHTADSTPTMQYFIALRLSR